MASISRQSHNNIMISSSSQSNIFSVLSFCYYIVRVCWGYRAYVQVYQLTVMIHSDCGDLSITWQYQYSEQFLLQFRNILFNLLSKVRAGAGDDDHVCRLSGMSDNVTWIGGRRGVHSSQCCQSGASVRRIGLYTCFPDCLLKKSVLND